VGGKGSLDLPDPAIIGSPELWRRRMNRCGRSPPCGCGRKGRDTDNGSPSYFREAVRRRWPNAGVRSQKAWRRPWEMGRGRGGHECGTAWLPSEMGCQTDGDPLVGAVKNWPRGGELGWEERRHEGS